VLAGRTAALRRDDVARPAIFVGAGTCGLAAGAGDTLDAVRAYLARRGAEADVVEVGCLGLCSAEPILSVQSPGRSRLSFGPVLAGKVAGLLDRVLRGTMPTAGLIGQHRQAGLEPWPRAAVLVEHPFFAPQTRRVLAGAGLADPSSIDESLARGGYKALAQAIRSRTPAEVCDWVDRSGLRGRAGGTPTGRKWKLGLAAHGDRKCLVCHAGECDPGAFVERAIVESDPHLVLEGLAIAAYAVGAATAYVYIRSDYALAIRRMSEAIDQAASCGLIGPNVLDSGFGLRVSVRAGPAGPVYGEETALVACLDGRRGMPRGRPPEAADRPAVVNSAETLANVPGIVANGPEWFAAVGADGGKGTKVLALAGRVARAGLVEAAMGTPLRRIVFGAGGGVTRGKRFKAAYVGGPAGGCVPEGLLDVPVDYESLRDVGACLGSGGIIVMDEDTCMVDMAKYFMDFFQRQSCGKCIPCREGTRRMLEVLQRITRPRAAERGLDALERFHGVMRLGRLAEVIRDTSLCRVGRSAPSPVLSTLRHFRDEYETHVYERRCPAGVCAELSAEGGGPAPGAAGAGRGAAKGGERW
jgi:NADH:ubiquinone oxidoreductase subunit F (NADH-binding)